MALMWDEKDNPNDDRKIVITIKELKRALYDMRHFTIGEKQENQILQMSPDQQVNYLVKRLVDIR